MRMKREKFFNKQKIHSICMLLKTTFAHQNLNTKTENTLV